jgi:NADPH:quinone reductase-like Zn-dependent oxidoreductase
MTEPSDSQNDPVDAGNPAPRARPFRNRREFAAYAWFRIVQTRRYWLLPVLALVLAASLLLNVFTGYNVLPAIYSLIP